MFNQITNSEITVNNEKRMGCMPENLNKNNNKFKSLMAKNTILSMLFSDNDIVSNTINKTLMEYYKLKNIVCVQFIKPVNVKKVEDFNIILNKLNLCSQDVKTFRGEEYFQVEINESSVEQITFCIRMAEITNIKVEYTPF